MKLACLEEVLNSILKGIEEKDNEIKKINDILNKARKCLEKYKKTNVEDYAKIIELYKEMDSILNNKGE